MTFQPPAAPLIGVGELARLLASAGPAPTLLDVRWRLSGPPGIESYQAGHVPGAVFVDLDRDLSGRPGPGGRHPLPAAADFQAAMRRAGVSDGRLVVVYDDADSMAAARAWWLLRYFGHSQVRVLDGGYRAWTQAGQPSGVSLHPSAADAGAPAAPVPEGDFTALPGHLPLLDAAAAAGLARTGLLLDARAAERYRGETEPVDPVAGHIPGAVNAPATENLNQDGTFRPTQTLATRFTSLADQLSPAPPAPASAPSASAQPGTPAPSGAAGDPGAAPAPFPAIGVYCGSGVTAAHEVLALTLAGLPAALYVGSWSEWITDPSRPIATGPTPG